MNTDKLKDLLDRVPVGLLIGAYMAYLGYDFYTLTNDPTSDLMTRQSEVARLGAEIQKHQEKLKQGQEFFRSLDAKRSQLREMAQKLDETKGTLTDDIDIASFIKMTITEAKKTGMTVVGIKPDKSEKKEFYEEQSFSMTFRGVYVQLLVFLERMSNVQKIVRSENFALRPTGSQSSKYVELTGAIELKIYRYLASQADEIGRGGASPAGAPGQGSGATPDSTGNSGKGG